MLLALTAVVAVNRFELNISTTDVLYFGSGTTGFARAESFVLLPLIFTFVAATFIPLARSLGLLFTQTAPLTAYTFDILGSLAGHGRIFPDRLFRASADRLVHFPGRARRSS